MKKVFRKIGSIVKKVAVPLLAIGAVVFTAGAALGLAPLAGGFGGAVSSALGAVGINGTGVIGSALTGAVTQAGYGAAIGGVGSMVTGGDFMDGAATGALAGAVTGGLTGATGFNAAKAADPSVTMSSRSLPTNPQGPLARPATNYGDATNGLGGSVAPMVAAPEAPPATTGFGGGWGQAVSGLISNPVVAQGLSGAANGLMTGMAAKDAAEADAEAQANITNSYNVDASVYDRTPAPDTTVRQRPRAKYNRQSRSIEYS